MTPPQGNKTQSSSGRDLYYDQARLSTISMLLCNKLDSLFEELGVGLARTSKMFYGPCPVHGGTNAQAFNLYHGGDVPGKWVCRTKHCEQTFKKTIIGFVRGMLSRDAGWNHPKDGVMGRESKAVSFHAAVDWCCKFLGTRLEDIRVNHGELEKHDFVSTVSTILGRPEKAQAKLTRADVRGRLQMPSSYFVKRGWLPETLNRYDVGLCTDASKPFFNRVVVPIYDEDYRFCVGFTARSIHERCAKCGLWHAPCSACPVAELQKYSKWTNSKGYSRESHLYNYWFAKKHIGKDGLAVLVEGPGDLWRLVEAGIEHGVAMCGSSLSDQQQIILEKSGAMTLIVLTNADEAGRKCAETIKRDLQRSYRIIVPELPDGKNDLGEIFPANVSAWLKPIIEKAKL